MDFREEYKNSAETLSPDKQTVERMKSAVLQQTTAPRKAFPFKRVAYIGGTVAACFIIGVVGISLANRTDSGISIAAENMSSSAVISDDCAAEEESAAYDTPTAATSAVIYGEPEASCDAAEPQAECEDIPANPGQAPDILEIADNTALTDGLGEDRAAEEIPEDAVEEPAAAAPTDADIAEEEADDIPIEEPVTDSGNETQPTLSGELYDLPLIAFSADMELCSFCGADYRRTEDAELPELYERVPLVTEDGAPADAYLTEDGSAAIIYIDGTYFGSYLRE